MGISQNKETVKVFYKNRIETLTDGVFAIAMTLLVTGLDIPNLNGIITSGTVDSLLLKLFPDFIHYIIAFVLLASFWWSSHLRSHYLQSIDSKMSFLNITTLFFVGLIPFSTNLAGDFPLNTHAVIIFELNLFAIGLLSVLQWNQIINNITCLDPDADTRMLILNREEAYIFPVLSSFAILLAIISIPWGIFIYFIAPVYIVLMWLKETRSHTIKEKPVHKTG
jgi:TMEM175 potassium channel family protein